eukprot:TRINITY_DN8703_c1_g2_i1.p1 TRINITY_DN8703_c1_g2~~TRINITY_DN8703_c1_g2_i1.p1  ORF type:complete len:720 (+),score=201.01 TRINITY_DN8703_c1_g2_i1:132-2291(+)
MSDILAKAQAHWSKQKARADLFKEGQKQANKSFGVSFSKFSNPILAESRVKGHSLSRFGRPRSVQSVQKPSTKSYGSNSPFKRSISPRERFGRRSSRLEVASVFRPQSLTPNNLKRAGPRNFASSMNSSRNNNEDEFQSNDPNENKSLQSFINVLGKNNITYMMHSPERKRDSEMKMSELGGIVPKTQQPLRLKPQPQTLRKPFSLSSSAIKSPANLLKPNAIERRGKMTPLEALRSGALFPSKKPSQEISLQSTLALPPQFNLSSALSTSSPSTNKQPKSSISSTLNALLEEKSVSGSTTPLSEFLERQKQDSSEVTSSATSILSSSISSFAKTYTPISNKASTEVISDTSSRAESSVFSSTSFQKSQQKEQQHQLMQQQEISSNIQFGASTFGSLSRSMDASLAAKIQELQLRKKDYSEKQKEREEKIRKLERMAYGGVLAEQIKKREEVLEDVETRMQRHEETEAEEEEEYDEYNEYYNNTFMLEPEDEELFDDSIQQRGGVILSNFEKAEMDAGHFQCLKSGAWLNDEVINYYFDLLRARSKIMEQNGDDNFPKMFAHSSFFFTRLTSGDKYDYKGVRRWTSKKKVDIFAMDVFLIPINCNQVHWTMCAVDMREKTVRYIDSMHGDGTSKCQTILRYLKDEHKNKKKTDLDVSEWSVYGIDDSVPVQRNGYDCGVFVCCFGNHLAADMPFNFSQDDIPSFRKHIGVSILKNEVSM